MGPKIKEMNCFHKLVDKNVLYFIKYGSLEYDFGTDEHISVSAIHPYHPCVLTRPQSRDFFFFWLEPVASFLFGTDLFPQAPGGMRCFWFFTCLSDPRVAVARLFLLILSSSLCRPGWITPLLLPTSGPPLISVMHAGDQNRTRDQLRGK